MPNRKSMYYTIIAVLDIFPKHVPSHHEAASCNVDENKGINDLGKPKNNDGIGSSFQTFSSIIALNLFSKHALGFKLLKNISCNPF